MRWTYHCRGSTQTPDRWYVRVQQTIVHAAMVSGATFVHATSMSRTTFVHAMIHATIAHATHAHEGVSRAVPNHRARGSNFGHESLLPFTKAPPGKRKQPHMQEPKAMTRPPGNLGVTFLFSVKIAMSLRRATTGHRRVPILGLCLQRVGGPLGSL